MATIEEVVQGLREGNSYERPLDDQKGNERLTPAGNDCVEHDVHGESGGGWAGRNVLTINTLLNGRWPSRGWQIIA